ncbi:valyl-tRNA synthetase [Pseudorhodobacter antarcticus]|uniref:Valine--tRNA ligase n=1 Tax=Pseudorhodobacter antarcticus TaxID=1077947 RepID=A0A1H8DN29_9RHOB|nr:valine--tRNA ligase [Pseudorhodobacter antarcticus]SEN07927.1 valyl-tRNA synthetase [Pseudorhodobacter antarcticus]
MPMEKTFNAAEAEARISAKWEADGAFRAGANASRDETFCIMIPPPNVTGSLHVGHAFNNTIQDILIRWKRMQGYDTLWQPGQDHAGIATQLVVERQMAAAGLPKRVDMGRPAFLEKVWEWKEESGGTIINQLQRLGASCDWSRNAFTMSGAPNAPETEKGGFHDAVIKVFVEMYNKGQIYRGKRLVNWDPHFETAISDLEVENIEVAGHMWHFKYPLAGGETYEYVERDEDGNVTLREVRDYISIATTRPETMLGDGAVAVHPSDERYTPILGKLCEIPVGPKAQRRLIPIITDEYPDKNFGSGAVKITGAHDFNDYQVAKRNNIPMYSLMDTKGAMRADGRPYAEEADTAQAIAAGVEGFDEAKIATMNLVPDEYRGLDRFEARKKVVADITHEGLAVTNLVKTIDVETNSEHLQLVPYVEDKAIMQPFGDRSGVVIEPMLTDQWFVDTAAIVQPALDAVREGRTKIMPESGEKVYFHWLENIEPWCISRQLWWGHQIPVWYGPKLQTRKDGVVKTGGIVYDKSKSLKENEFDVFCAPTEAAALEMARAHYGTDVTVESGLIPSVLRMSSSSQAVPIFRDPDVLDTWFSSGLWPIGTLGWPNNTPELQKYFPTNVLVTGQDILFFWVARMMMMQLAVVGKEPFDTVYLHQLVRDEKGEKMSKTRGNVIDPLVIIDEYGADALRFTMAQMASLGGVLKLSEDRIKGYRNFTTKLWNACRFAEINGVWEGHATSEAPHADARVNRWIISEAAKTRAEVDAALEAYKFNDAANALYAFVWGKVCDWYVEFAKPLFDGDQADETRKTMAWVLDQCMILLHPIMPFITEELWNTTGTRAKSLAHTDWPTYGDALIDADALREMNWVTGLIDGIRSARAQMHVPAGLKVDLLCVGLDDAAKSAFAANEALIFRLARIETATGANEVPKGSITVATEGATFAIPLEGLIDVAEEKSRLTKALEKLDKDMGGLRGRLNNPKFVGSAKPEVVAETREKLALGEDEIAKIKAALTRLAEMS